MVKWTMGVTSVTVPGGHFLKLLELATDAVCMQDEEFSNLPTEEEIRLLEVSYALLSHPIPEKLQSAMDRSMQNHKTKNSEVKPDERETGRED